MARPHDQCHMNDYLTWHKWHCPWKIRTYDDPSVGYVRSCSLEKEFRGAGPRSWWRLIYNMCLFTSTSTSMVLDPWRFVMSPWANFSLRGFIVG